MAAVATIKPPIPMILPAYKKAASDFDIRISDFNHSGCFMQNKAKVKIGKMNLSPVIIMAYDNEL